VSERAPVPCAREYAGAGAITMSIMYTKGI
jgi:hypothetical protein